MMISWGLEKSDRSSMSTNSKWASEIVEDEEIPVLNGESSVISCLEGNVENFWES